MLPVLLEVTTRIPYCSDHIRPLIYMSTMKCRLLNPYIFPLNFPLQFEVYFAKQGVLTEGLTVSIVAQLGAGATAGHWKVDLYEFVGKDDWTNIGDLTDCELLFRFLLCLLDNTQQPVVRNLFMYIQTFTPIRRHLKSPNHHDT